MLREETYLKSLTAIYKVALSLIMNKLCFNRTLNNCFIIGYCFMYTKELINIIDRTTL